MAEPLSFLTFEDVIGAGACTNGVINACLKAGVFFGTIDDVLSAFPGERARIVCASNLDGYGDGDGDGYGYGDGDGDGYGDGDGDGDGDGYGYEPFVRT